MNDMTWLFRALHFARGFFVEYFVALLGCLWNSTLIDGTLHTAL